MKIRDGFITLFCTLFVLGSVALAQTAKFSVLPNASAFLSGTYGSQYGGVVLLEGFGQPGDGGGGLFTSPPTSQQNTCQATTGQVLRGNLQQIQNVSPFPLGLVKGMEVVGENITQNPPTTVTGFSVSQNYINLSQAATGVSKSGTPYQLTLIAGNNTNPTGWAFLDNAGYCFTRASSTFSQKEWGAVSNGSADDTLALQNWLYTNQPHLAVAGNSIISTTLYCGVDASLNMVTDGGVIQGPPPSAIGAPDQMPAFRLTGSDVPPNGKSFTGSDMLYMGEYQCGVSALGLVGSQAYNLIDATVGHNSILNHSQLYGGLDGVDCSEVANVAHADFTIEDSSIVLSAAEGVNGHCPNLKIEGNMISQTSSDGILYQGTQGFVEQNIFQQNYGNGFTCLGSQLALFGNYSDDNGLKGSSTSNFLFSGCDAASVVGNIFYRSAGATEGTIHPTSQVFFQNENDSISLAGNADFVGNDLDAPQMRPDYDIELKNTSGTTVTDFSYADSATPQNAVSSSQNGVFGPNGAPLIGAAYQPVQENYFAGLPTRIVATPPPQQELNIQPGVAADSLNAQLLTLPIACTVNLANSGVGGLDSPPLHSSTQYNYFIFAQGGNASPTYCIASAQSAPNFVQAGAPKATLYGFATQGSYTLINVTPTLCTLSGAIWTCPNQNPFGGIAVGDAVTDSANFIPPNTTVAALSSINATLTGVTTQGSTVVGNLSSTSNLYIGEMVGDGNAGTWFAANTYIVSISPTNACGMILPPCLTLTQPALANSNAANPAHLAVSGLHALTLNNQAVSGSSSWCTGNPCNTSGADVISVYNDRYRLVASLYTDSNSTPDIAGFTQNGNTFLLNPPVADISTTALVPGTPTAFTLHSIPSGQPVLAFGRCVANAMVHIFSRGANPGEPAAFSTVPGYDTQAISLSVAPPSTSFPFRVWTDSLSEIYAESGPHSPGNTTLYCMTDGYVLPTGYQKTVFPPVAKIGRVRPPLRRSRARA